MTKREMMTRVKMNFDFTIINTKCEEIDCIIEKETL